MDEVATKGQQTVKDGLPPSQPSASAPPAPKVMRNRRAVSPEAPLDGSVSSTETTNTAMGIPEPPGNTLRAYVAYRRGQLYAPRLGGHIGGARAVQDQQVELVLKVLEDMAAWLDEGQPPAAARLNQEDLGFWLDARRRGMEIPDEIARALPPVG